MGPEVFKLAELSNGSYFGWTDASEAMAEAIAERVKFDSIYGIFLITLDRTNSVDEESKTLIESISMRNEWCG